MFAVQSERLICAKWVAERTGLSEREIRKLAQTGVLPAIRVGKKLWKFRAGEVERFKQVTAIRPRCRRGAGGHNARSF